MINRSYYLSREEISEFTRNIYFNPNSISKASSFILENAINPDRLADIFVGEMIRTDIHTSKLAILHTMKELVNLSISTTDAYIKAFGDILEELIAFIV